MDNVSNSDRGATAVVEQALHTAMSAGWEVRGTTSPNPPVGAAIISTSGEILGTGATQPVGGAHAGVQAVAEAVGKTRGAPAVVTLEPCRPTGRTGPCTQALIAAGIKEVCYLHSGPNADAGGGAQVLRDAGVNVVQLSAPEGTADAVI